MGSFIILLIILVIAIIKDAIRYLLSIITYIASATSSTHTNTAANPKKSLYNNAEDDWPYEFELYDIADCDIDEL